MHHRSTICCFLLVFTLAPFSIRAEADDTTQQILSGSQAAVKKAIGQLQAGEAREDIVAAMVQRLSTEAQTGLRTALITGLRDHASLPQLIQVMLPLVQGDSSPTIRRQATWALVYRDARDAAEPLAKAARVEPEVDIRKTILKAVDDLYGGRAADVRELLLVDPDPSVRALCARIMNRNPDPYDPQVRDALLRALEDSNEKVAIDAAHALLTRNVIDAIEALDQCATVDGKRGTTCADVAAQLRASGNAPYQPPKSDPVVTITYPDEQPK